MIIRALIVAVVLVGAPPVWGQEDDATVADGDATETVVVDDAAEAPESRVRDGRHFFIAGTIGYAANIAEVSGLLVEPYGLGYGGSLGWTFDSGFYLGGSFILYEGGMIEQEYRGYTLKTEASSWLAHLDVGYDLWVSFLLMRFKVGLGVSHLDLIVARTTDWTTTAFVLTPSLSFFVPISFFVFGVEGTFPIATSYIPAGAGINGLIGVRF